MVTHIFNVYPSLLHPWSERKLLRDSTSDSFSVQGTAGRYRFCGRIIHADQRACTALASPLMRAGTRHVSITRPSRACIAQIPVGYSPFERVKECEEQNQSLTNAHVSRRFFLALHSASLQSERRNRERVLFNQIGPLRIGNYAAIY